MEKEGKFKEIQRLRPFKPPSIPDENRSLNSTKYDSLNNILFPPSKPRSIPCKLCSSSKTNNFFKALCLIQGKAFLNSTKSHISEFSETNANNSKEENVATYFNNALRKTVTKDGNQLKVSFHKHFTTSINVPYRFHTIFESLLSNIIEIDDDEEEEIALMPQIALEEKIVPKGSVYNCNYKANNKASTADYTDNNGINHLNEDDASLGSDDFAEVKPFSMEIIDDLDEMKEVNVSDYQHEVKKRFPTSNEKEQICGEIFISDSLMSNERYNHIHINGCLFSQTEGDKQCNKSQTEVMLSLKQRTTTEKKIPQKYHRRELADSFTSSKSIKLNQRVNTNLIDKFNQCDDHLNQSIKGSGKKDASQSLNDNAEDISLDAEMVDFITDNDSDDSGFPKKHSTHSSHIKKSFNDLTPIRLTYSLQEDIYSTPKDKVKKFLLPLPSAKLTPYPLRNSNEVVIIKEEEEGQTVYDIDFINNLLARDSHSKAKANYIANHPNLKWSYRATLIDWLMEISEEFAFKRDTFHYAINYIDRYLSRQANCEKKYLQLLGITCLGIAAKIEEVQIPKLIEYAKATDESYSDQEIIATEKKVLKTLQWEIIPITLNTWMNWYICQWDLFLDTFEEMVFVLIEAYSKDNVIYFKRPDDKAYYNFRKAAQIIDLCALHEKSLGFDSRSLVASTILMVLILGYDMEVIDELTIEQLDGKFYQSLLRSRKEYVEVYKDFIKQSFNFDWEDQSLIDSMTQVGKFMKYTFKYEVPLVYQVSSTEIENGNYEDFISYQTYNEQNLHYLELIGK